MEIGEAQLHLTSDGSRRCTLHETLFCRFARLLVLVPDFQNGNMTLLFIVKTVRRSKIRLFFFFRGSGIVFPLPNTVYIFETHVILWKTLLPDVLSDAISSKIRFRNPPLSYIDKEEEEILVFSNRNSSTFLRIENYNIRYLWEREREYNRKLLTRFVEDAIYAERETLFETRRENYALNAHFTHRVEIFDSTRFINHRTERNESVKVYG